MLTPEVLHALDQAITAVIHEAGTDPEYEGLVHALTAAQDAMPDSKADQAEDAPEHGAAAFQDAKSKMIAARKGPA
jgi:hypothetical protein